MTSEKHKLAAQTRALTGRKVKQLRKSGQVPGNIFGNNLKSVSIQLDTKKFLEVFSKAGESSLIYLHLDQDKEPRPIFVSQVTNHPLTGEIVHVSLHQVDLKEKVTAPVPVIISGESQAEKEKVGIMVQQSDEIEVEALPADMPENIQIDVSDLAQPGDNITVKDLKLDSSKVTVKSDPDMVLVQIEALAKEEVAEVAPTTEAATGETDTVATTEPTAATNTPEKTS